MKSGYDQLFSKMRKVAMQKSKKTKSKEIYWRLTSIALGLACPCCFIWVFEPNLFSFITSKMDIQWYGSARAAEEKSSLPEAKTAAVGDSKPQTPPVATIAPCADEAGVFSKLSDRKRELDQREAELNKLDEELQQQKVSLEKRMQELEDLRSKIGSILKDRIEVDKERVTKLVDFYSSMKPQQAARIIGTLDEDLAIETLSRMKKKDAAEIFNLLDPKKAQALSERFAGYKQ